MCLANKKERLEEKTHPLGDSRNSQLEALGAVAGPRSRLEILLSDDDADGGSRERLTLDTRLSRERERGGGGGGGSE